MNRTRPHHAFQLVIEDAWDAGHTPRLLVKSDAPGLVLPQDVIARFDGRPIPLDLEPSYPLNPEFEPRRLLVDLAFSGSIVRCTLPWEAIFAVTIRETGVDFIRVVPANVKTGAPPTVHPGVKRIIRKTTVEEEFAVGPTGPPENAGKHAAPSKMPKHLSFNGLRSIKGGKDES